MNPTQEKKIQTSVGMETATETVNRVNQARTPAQAQGGPSPELTNLSISMANQPPITANNVPMSNLATTQQSVNMPTPEVIPSDVQGTLSAGQQVAEEYAAGEQARADQAGQKYSASEQILREYYGILGTESDTRSQKEEQAGVNVFSQDLQTLQQNLRRQTADLDQFDVDNVNTIEQMRVDSSKRDITKRTFNAMSAEAGIQMAVQRANKVASTRVTIAAIDITQGNLTAATEQVDKALKAIYDPIRMGIQMETQFLQNNLSLFNTAQTSAANARIKVMEQEVKEIDRATGMVDSAVASGFLSGDELSEVISITNPTAQIERTQQIIARGIQKQIADAKAAAASSGFDTPDVKNFGTTDAPIWRQWNAATGEWQDVSGIEGTQAVEQVQQSLDQLSFLRDTAARILGGESADGTETYDALYEAAGPSGVGKFLGDTFIGDTDYRRLETYADTLRTNVLALMTDPSVKKFFGPQMSNADVKLMSATGSSLRPESNSPEDIKSETIRLDDLLNRMETAVKNGQSGIQVQGPVQQTATNVITAPDGLQIEIID